jgi:membrane protease YdiL (CAAX protease family)
MNQISGWMRRRPIVSFYVITFAITWGLGFSYIAVLKNQLFLLLPLTFVATCGPALAGIIVTAVSGGQGRPKLGRNRMRWLVFVLALIACTPILLANLYIFDGVTITPVLALFSFFLLTPSVATIISAAFSRGTAVRAMMASLVRLRGVAGWALLALVLIPGVLLLSVAASDLLGRQPAAAVSSEILGAPLLGLVGVKFLYQFFFFNATGEESGWSGFARPHLQARVSPLITALIITLFWVPWHFFLWYGEGQDVFTLSFWFEFTIIHISPSIIITWLFNRSRGSILVAGIAHAAANTADAFLPNLDWVTYTAMMAIAALLLVLIDGMWKRLPQEDPAVSHAPRLAV